MTRMCFGLISTFDFESKHCQACEQFESCSHEVLRTACRIENAIDIRPVLQKHLELKKRFPTIKDAEISYDFEPSKKRTMAQDLKSVSGLSYQDQRKLLGLTSVQRSWASRLLGADLRSGKDFLEISNVKKVPTLKIIFQMAIAIKHGVNTSKKLQLYLRKYNQDVTDTTFKNKFTNALTVLKALKIVTGEHIYELQDRD